MNYKLQQCLVIETGKLSPIESLVGRIPVKEGTNLPNSVTEDVGGFSLCPAYSTRQQRRIHRLKMKGVEREWRRKSGKADGGWLL